MKSLFVKDSWLFLYFINFWMNMLNSTAYARNPSAESQVSESRPLLQQIGNELAAQVGEVLINESNLQLGQTIGQGKL